MLSDKQVKKMRERYLNTPASLQDLGDEYGMSRQAVHYIIQGETYSDAPGPILGEDYTQEDVIRNPLDLRIDEISSLYKEDKKHIKEIAEKLGTSYYKVRECLKRAGIERRKGFPSKLSDEQVASMRRKHREGVTQKELSKEYEISHGYVSSVVRGKRRESAPGPILWEDYGKDPKRAGIRRMFSNEEAKEIREKRIKQNIPWAKLAEEYDVSVSAVRNIVMGKSYKDAPGPTLDGG